MKKKLLELSESELDARGNWAVAELQMGVPIDKGVERECYAVQHEFTKRGKKDDWVRKWNDK